MDSGLTTAHFASLPSIKYDSVPTKNTDTDSKLDTPLISVERGSTRKFLSPRLLLPTVAVVLGTAGLAITLIVWILTHETQASLAEAYRRGTFLLDEGYDVEDGLEAGRLIGLTISSAASTAIGLFTPIFMGLYAYRTTSLWVTASGTDLPTPLQYGLLLDALGGAGVITLANTWIYFLSSRGKRKISPLLIEAFIVAVLAYVLVHAVSAVDLWLHTVTSSVVEVADIPTIPFNYSFGAACAPYDGTTSDSCQWSAGGWQGNRVSSMLALSSNSELHRAITLYDVGARNLAVMVAPDVPQSVAFQAISFGARASCDSLNLLCTNGVPYANLSCPGFPQDQFPVTNSTRIATNPGSDVPVTQSGTYFLTGFCPTCDHLGTNRLTIANAKSRVNEITPYSIWLQMVWDGSSQYIYREVNSRGNNTALTAEPTGATLLANCSLSIYNVTLAYRNGSYSVLHEEPTNSGQADAMFVPTRFGFFSSNLVSSIEGIAFQANTTADVMTILSQNLARFAIAAAAPAVSSQHPTLSQSLLVPRILGRYPFWPIFVTLLLLFLYAAFALVICVATAFAKAEVIHVPSQARPVLSLDLAVLRLTNHVAIAAEMFPEGDEDARVGFSMQTDAMKMHDEEGARDMRIKVGLHEDRDGGALMFSLCRDDFDTDQGSPYKTKG